MNFKLSFVCIKLVSDGQTITNTSVLEFPPKLSYKSLVNLLSRYGILLRFGGEFLSPNKFMILFSVVKLLLMNAD